MLISKLIETLQVLKDKHGDTPVYYAGEDGAEIVKHVSFDEINFEGYDDQESEPIIYIT